MVAGLYQVPDAVKSLWTDVMSVTEHRAVKNQDKTTGFKDVEVLSGEPCRLVYKALRTADEGDAAKLVQSVKLICDKGITINEGSKIVIEHEGRTLSFKMSGVPAVYTMHQEIMLEPFERWA